MEKTYLAVQNYISIVNNALENKNIRDDDLKHFIAQTGYKMFGDTEDVRLAYENYIVDLLLKLGGIALWDTESVDFVTQEALDFFITKAIIVATWEDEEDWAGLFGRSEGFNDIVLAIYHIASYLRDGNRDFTDACKTAASILDHTLLNAYR